MLEACALLKWSWSSFCMPLSPPWISLAILSVLAFQSCWFTAYIWSCSILANSEPDGLFGHLTCSSHAPSVTDLFDILCVINTFLQGLSSLYLISLFDLSEMRCFLSFFLLLFLALAQFCCWGLEESCWFLYRGLLASERHGVGGDICLGSVSRPRTGIQLCEQSWKRAKTELSRFVTVESHLGFLKFSIKIFLDWDIPHLLSVELHLC